MADQTNVQQNQIPNEPELADLLALLKKDIFLGLNCHHIGTIQSFDPLKQVATATINYRRTYFKHDPAGGEYVPELVPYPVLLDCPVVFLGGGNGALTFPVAEGDECIVLINDRDIDNWFSGSSDSAVATPRLHSVADALILVGVRSLANVIAEFDGSAVSLRTKDGVSKVSIDVDSGDVTIQAGVAGLTILVGADGKMSFTNAGGEFVAAVLACLNALTTGTAGGYPLVLPPDFATNLAIAQAFQE